MKTVFQFLLCALAATLIVTFKCYCVRSQFYDWVAVKGNIVMEIASSRFHLEQAKILFGEPMAEKDHIYHNHHAKKEMYREDNHHPDPRHDLSKYPEYHVNYDEIDEAKPKDAQTMSDSFTAKKYPEYFVEHDDSKNEFVTRPAKLVQGEATHVVAKNQYQQTFNEVKPSVEEAAIAEEANKVGPLSVENELARQSRILAPKQCNPISEDTEIGRKSCGHMAYCKKKWFWTGLGGVCEPMQMESTGRHLRKA